MEDLIYVVMLVIVALVVYIKQLKQQDAFGWVALYWAVLIVRLMSEFSRGIM